MTEQKEYRLIRIKPETHRKLRILAANSGESIINLIDRLATEEQEIKTMTTEPNYQELARKYGIIELEFLHLPLTFWLTDQADFSSRLFDGNGLNANEGETYTVEFSCPAIDMDGHHYEIYWQFDGIVKGEEPEPDAYPFDNDHIVRIVPQ